MLRGQSSQGRLSTNIDPDSYLNALKNKYNSTNPLLITHHLSSQRIQLNNHKLSQIIPLPIHPQRKQTWCKQVNKQASQYLRKIQINDNYKSLLSKKTIINDQYFPSKTSRFALKLKDINKEVTFEQGLSRRMSQTERLAKNKINEAVKDNSKQNCYQKQFYNMKNYDSPIKLIYEQNKQEEEPMPLKLAIKQNRQKIDLKKYTTIDSRGTNQIRQTALRAQREKNRQVIQNVDSILSKIRRNLNK